MPNFFFFEPIYNKYKQKTEPLVPVHAIMQKLCVATSGSWWCSRKSWIICCCVSRLVGKWCRISFPLTPTSEKMHCVVYPMTSQEHCSLTASWRKETTTEIRTTQKGKIKGCTKSFTTKNLHKWFSFNFYYNILMVKILLLVEQILSPLILTKWFA